MTVSYQAMRGLANVPWYWAFTQADIVNFNDSATTVTASATSHTKGAWAQLIASTSDESSLLFLRVDNVGVAATETSMLLDVAVGASGSEVAIASDIAIGGASLGSLIAAGVILPLPVRIASGSRISARVQSLISSDNCTIRFSILKFSARQMLPTAVDVLGADTATSRGTAFSGASGSWTQVTASTAQRYRAMWLVPSAIGTNMTDATTTLEIGFGAAGSEVSIGKQRVRYTVNETAFHESTAAPAYPIACDIPAGSRVAVKHAFPSNPDRYGVCVIGIP
jgi:hypothetical protein